MLGSRTVPRPARLLLICILLSVLATACGGDAQKPQAPRVVPAAVSQVAAETVIECRAFPAQVESRNSVTLASKLSGAVVEVFADEGASLAAGQAILRIDDRDLQSRSQGLTAQVGQASMERQALAARSAHAKNNLDRLERLAAQKVISQDDYERAKSEYMALKREEEAIASREKAVAFQREELASLAGYTRINAPFAGILARRYVDLGAFVGAGQPLALIDDTTAGFDLAAQVDESFLASVRVGQDIVAAVPGLVKQPFLAQVSAVVGRVDPGSRSFKLKAALPAGAGGGKTPSAGMFGRVFIPARTGEKLLLPARCLRQRGDLPVVFALDKENLVHLRVIKTGGAFHKVAVAGRTYLTDSEAFDDPGLERFLEAVSGLAAGDRLACGQTESLREGDQIVEAAK